MRGSNFILSLLAFLLFSADAGAGTIDDLRANGKIRIGVRQDTKPFSYYNEIGEPAGYTVDLCRAIAVHLKTAAHRARS